MEPLFQLFTKSIVYMFVIVYVISVVKEILSLHGERFYLTHDPLYQRFLLRNRILAGVFGVITIISFWFLTQNCLLIFDDTCAKLPTVLCSTLATTSTIISFLFFLYFCLRIVFKKKDSIAKEYVD